jgi:hypothetical protein
VHHYHDEPSAAREYAMAAFPHRRQRRDVLDCQNDDRGVECARGEDVREASGVADSEVDRGAIGLAPPSRRLDQRRGDVDSGDACAAFGECATEHALATSDVDHTLAALRIQKLHGARDDNLSVVLAAALADEVVVPGRDVLPAASARESTAVPSFSRKAHRNEVV